MAVEILVLTCFLLDIAGGGYIEVHPPPDGGGTEFEVLKDYVQTGDLLIGGAWAPSIHLPGRTCANTEKIMLGYKGQQRVEALKFAIDQVNQDPSILPHVKLGFAQSIRCQDPQHQSGAKLYTRFLPLNKNLTTANQLREEIRSYDVVAVIGGETSPEAKFGSGLMGGYHIPYILPIVTADELSDRTTYPYTLRTIPPDRYQKLATMKFLQHYNWTYSLLLYNDKLARSDLHEIADGMNLCISQSFYVPPGWTAHHRQDKFNELVQRMARDRSARVVIVWIARNSFRHVLDAVDRAKLAGEQTSSSFRRRDVV